MLLSHFRQHDREILRDLHQDPKHDRFLHSFARFQIHQSKQREGGFWIGGLKGEKISLSEELFNAPAPIEPMFMNEIYQDYKDLLQGELDFAQQPSLYS